jgi:hypothetical protein
MWAEDGQALASILYNQGHLSEIKIDEIVAGRRRIQYSGCLIQPIQIVL